MRWRRSLIIWLGLFTVFSLYNISPVLLAPPEPLSTFVDPKVLSYNFTMAQPNSVHDSFTAQVILARSPDSYNIRAYFYEWFNLQSVSAYGEYQLNYTIYVNGVKGTDSHFFILWHRAPYGLSAQGQLPNIAQVPLDEASRQENLTGFQRGVNLVQFQFTQASKLVQYGEGFYNLILGPLSVDVGSKSFSFVGPLALEFIVGLLLVPTSHLVSLASYKFRTKKNPQLG